MRCTFLKCPEDRFADVGGVFAELGVAKSEFLDTDALEVSGPFPVIRLLRREPVLKSVQFDGKPCLLAEEIEDVITGGMLSSEFVSAESPAAEPAPDELLSPRGAFTEGAGALLERHTGQRNESLDVREAS